MSWSIYRRPPGPSDVPMFGPGDEAAWGPIVDPRDPRADDPDEYTSMQPIGCGETLVCYTVESGIVAITGAYIGADVVEPEEFAAHRITAWTLRIQAEVDRDREDAADCGEWAA